MLGNLKKNRPFRPFADSLKEGPADASSTEVGVHGNVQNFRFVADCLTPRTETNDLSIADCEQERIVRIITEGPLGGLGAT